MKFRLFENQSHRIQVFIEAESGEEAVQKWIQSRGDGFDFKDLDEYFIYYEVESQDKK